MSQVSGKVNALNSKKITAKTGKQYVIYTADIDGTLVNVGFNKPPIFKVGDEVTIETEAGYKGELKYTEGTIKAGAVAGGGGSVTPINRNSGTSAFGVVGGDREISIIRQSALKAAVDVINSANPKTTIDERYDAIIQLARKFAKFSSGQLDVEEAKKLVTAKATAKADDDLDREIAANA